MAPSQSDLLRNAVALDQKLNKGKASVSTAPSKLPFPTDDDPFGGNENNRKAAAKAAGINIVEPTPDRPNEDDDQESNQASIAPDQSQSTVAASVPPVTAPVAPVAATLTKAQKKAAEKAAAQSGPPTWNRNA
jgi:hypothetical protein